jgi:glycosyltransferase involved in cell wall biosynthesis
VASSVAVRVGLDAALRVARTLVPVPVRPLNAQHIWKQEKSMRHVYMLIHQIGMQAGGMTLSMMTRANLFQENGWRTALVTTDPKRDYREVEAEYWRLGLLDADVRILNIFEHHRQTAGAADPERRGEFAGLTASEEPGMLAAPSAGSEGLGMRYFDASGRYRLYKQWRRDGSLEYVDFFDDAHRRTRRVEFNSCNEARRELSYDPYGTLVVQDRFLDSDGFCYVMRWHGVKTRAVYKVLTFQRSGVVSEYDSMLDWEISFFNGLAAQGSERPVFIGDGIGAIASLPQVRANGALRYMQIHNNHLKAPWTDKREVLDDHARVFRQARSIDGIVVLTDRQRRDIDEVYGIGDITHVIPHSFADVPVETEDREPCSAVTVARLSDQKAIDAAIRAFRHVVAQIPQAVYRIYGSGPERDALARLIEECGLRDNVFLEGFARRPTAALARAQVSLITSVYEGFCLVAAESCLQETPVVAFDVDYGPSDIVPSPRHGSILPTRDEEEMAREIVRYFTDERLRRKNGSRARKSVLDRFGEREVFSCWGELLA